MDSKIRRVAPVQSQVQCDCTQTRLLWSRHLRLEAPVLVAALLGPSGSGFGLTRIPRRNVAGLQN